jgi:hypothetical protein
MAKLLESTFADVAATGNSAAKNIGDLENVYVMIYGTFVGAWNISVSFDGGTTWAVFQSGTESGVPLVSSKLPPCSRARIGFTRTSGMLKAGYAGDKRTAGQ